MYERINHGKMSRLEKGKRIIDLDLTMARFTASCTVDVEN